jgi:hypothetical protein
MKTLLSLIAMATLITLSGCNDKNTFNQKRFELTSTQGGPTWLLDTYTGEVWMFREEKWVSFGAQIKK